MVGPIDLVETEYYCALLVEITSCIMLKQLLKLGYRCHDMWKRTTN